MPVVSPRKLYPPRAMGRLIKNKIYIVSLVDPRVLHHQWHCCVRDQDTPVIHLRLSHSPVRQCVDVEAFCKCLMRDWSLGFSSCLHDRRGGEDASGACSCKCERGRRGRGRSGTSGGVWKRRREGGGSGTRVVCTSCTSTTTR